jgi:hypothetical protein
VVVGGGLFLLNSMVRRNQIQTLYNEVYHTRQELQELKKGLMDVSKKK